MELMDTVQTSFTVLVSLILIAFPAELAICDQISIVNPSFEDPHTGHQNGALPTGWSVEGSDYGTELNPSDGLQCMFAGSGSGGQTSIYQVTNHTVKSGDEYILSFDAKFTWSEDIWPGSYKGSLFYDNNGSRIALQTVSDTHSSSSTAYTWRRYDIRYQVPSGSPAIGKKLGFEFFNTTEITQAWGIWAGVDNVSLAEIANIEPSDYYVDSSGGSDQNSGTSDQDAWASLAPVNNHIFMPGDRLFLKSGTSYAGQLRLRGTGSSQQPIIVKSYGQGTRPRIDGQGLVGSALLIENFEYIEVSDLELTNQGASREGYRYGVHLLANSYDTVNHIHLKDLYVHDVNGTLVKNAAEGCGILFQTTGSTLSRFDDLLIQDCHVLRTDRNGICGVTGQNNRNSNFYPSLNVVIRNNLIEDCGGDCIKPWGCDGCLVERNIVRGGRRRCEDYAAGIWPWSCDNTLIQYNEVTGMKGTRDGQGFDSDYNCYNTLFQYNYSHDNDGGFMLVCGPAPSGGIHGCVGTVIRYNISQNDGIAGARVFHISGGGVRNTLIHNNVIYVGPQQSLPMIKFDNWSGNTDETYVYNNIFYVDGSVSYEYSGSTNNIFNDNVFFGNHTNTPTGLGNMTLNPKLLNPGSGSSGLASLDGYKLRTDSPCIKAGTNLVANGNFDFWRNRIDLRFVPDIGAHAFSHTFPGDFNSDGNVDSDDIFSFANEWLGTNYNYDLNGDGQVDFADYAIFVWDWFGY